MNLSTTCVGLRPVTRHNPLVLLGISLCVEAACICPAAGATLQELLDGGSIIAGNARFSNWELNSLSSTTGIPDIAQITVVPLLDDVTNPGLQFIANGQLSVAVANSIDLMFSYRVDAVSAGSAFTSHAVGLTGLNFAGNGGLALIADDLRDASGADLPPTLVIDDKASNLTRRQDISSFAPQSAISVATNVVVSGASATDRIQLTSFTHRFAQSGPAFAAADFDEDGDVDAADLRILNAGFGVANATHAQGDADGDAVVDGKDFLIWQRLLGSPPPARDVATSAPEPSSALLVALAALGIYRQLQSVRLARHASVAPPYVLSVRASARACDAQNRSHHEIA